MIMIIRKKRIAYLHNKILMNHKVPFFSNRYISCPFLSVIKIFCKLIALESSNLTTIFRKSYAMFVYR